MYKGEVVAQGNFKQFYDELTGIFKRVKNGRFEGVLEGVIDISVLKKNNSFNTVLAEVRLKRNAAKFLTIEEEAVLRFYTTNAGYKNLNKALRGEAEMTEDFLAQERLMNAALQKLPKSVYNQPGKLLYRIEYLSEAQINEYYKVGKTITNKHFTSATYDEFAIGKAMARRPYTILIRIEAKNGKLIEDLSTLKKEKEILFASKTEFYVKSIGLSNNPEDYASTIKTIRIIEK